MAKVSTELFHAVDGCDWVGFYRVAAPDLLNIGPCHGEYGCLAIPFDHAVCGAAVGQWAIQLVDDVDRF
jgi:L-methionine (R)-S-oxide reductase